MVTPLTIDFMDHGWQSNITQQNEDTSDTYTGDRERLLNMKHAWAVKSKGPESDMENTSVEKGEFYLVIN